MLREKVLTLVMTENLDFNDSGNLMYRMLQGMKYEMVDCQNMLNDREKSETEYRELTRINRNELFRWIAAQLKSSMVVLMTDDTTRAAAELSTLF